MTPNSNISHILSASFSMIGKVNYTYPAAETVQGWYKGVGAGTPNWGKKFLHGYSGLRGWHPSDNPITLEK